MKKKLLLSVLASSLIIPLTSCSSGKHYDEADYVLEMEYKENFKIIQLTDIHIANKDDRDRQYEFIRESVRRANESGKADLIVLSGDNFTFGTKIVAKELFEFVDSFEIPWTITWGNHDEQCYFSIDWVTGYLNDLNESKDSYCMFIDHQDDDVTGNANFVINLKQGNKIKEQIIIIDSLRYHYGFDYIGYDYIHQDQIDWYKRMVNYTTQLNGGEVVHSIIFQHIPLPEYQDAWDAYEANDPNVEYCMPGGVNGDSSQGAPEINTGFFDVIKEMGSTDGMFVGHAHLNNWILKYQGIYLGYGVTSSDRIYFDEDLLGCSTYTIKSDNSLEFGQIVRSYSEYR